MTILRADSTQPFPSEVGLVHTVVTSPPYFGLRNYGDDDSELGAPGESLDDYLVRLVRVMSNCRDVLAEDGLVFVNIADTASKSGGAGGDYNKGGSKENRPKWKQGESGLPPMTWCNVPGKFVEAMLADGWLLRMSIVWDKGRERREALDHVRRPRPAHEYIFMFAANRKHRFVSEGLTETGSVWHFPPEKSGKKGQAPFPDELARRCISCSTLPGMTVLDPFAGSGTTIKVAESLGMHGVGIDLYAGLHDYAPSD